MTFIDFKKLLLDAELTIPKFTELIKVSEKNKQTEVTQTANGTDLINIANPNGQGVSYNDFDSFNVGQNGVIFNNSKQTGTSQTGGIVEKNTNLNNTANLVIGEVTGKDISKISDNEMRPLRSDIQMVFQDPYGSLNPRMKVQDLIGEPLLIHTNMTAGERLKKVH